MIKFTAFHRTAIAALGALVISTACIGAAVGPAASAGKTQVAAVKLVGQARA